MPAANDPTRCLRHTIHGNLNLMTIAITGASGFIGRRLMKALASGDHKLRVLSRHAGTNLPPGVQLYVWDAMKGQPSEESLDGVDAVVHLAGEPIAQRWNDDVKLKIRESRATGTRNLVQALSTDLGREPGRRGRSSPSGGRAHRAALER